MTRPTTPIDLSPEQSKLLQSIVASREVPHGLVQPAKIILAASQMHASKAIAVEMGLCEDPVGPRRRWLQGCLDLEKLESKPKHWVKRSALCWRISHARGVPARSRRSTFAGFWR